MTNRSSELGFAVSAQALGLQAGVPEGPPVGRKHYCNSERVACRHGVCFPGFDGQSCFGPCSLWQGGAAEIPLACEGAKDVLKLGAGPRG